MMVLPFKNSTLAIVPSLSVAVALSEIVAGAVKVAPLSGLVRLTLGALLPGPGSVPHILTPLS
jgi:hypothetical protein